MAEFKTTECASEEVTNYSLTDQELATVLAALRLWKNEQDGESPDDAMLEDIATNGGRHPKLGSEAIDDLCERLNLVDVIENPEDDDDENTCRTCGEPYEDGGDGYDGECPDCADRTDQKLHPENYE